MTQFDLSIVVACYNEEPHLLRSILKIEKIMNLMNYSYEFVFIDDCSKDNTRDVVKKICENRDNCRYIFHEKNVGRGGTVKEGLLLAKGKFVGFLDIDLEVPAHYLPAILIALEEGYDMACIARIYEVPFSINGLFRLILSEGYKKIAHLTLKLKCPDSEAGFKFFNLETMRSIIVSTEDKRWFWDTEIIAMAEKNNKHIKSIPGVFVRDNNKQSTVKLIPDSIEYIKAIRRFKKSHNWLSR